jgi:CHASE2 domain-containing sensor protein/signal transduction histidine kinase
VHVKASSFVFSAGRFTGRLRWEWLLTLLLTLFAAAALHSTSWVQQVNGWLYDKLLSMHAKPTNPAIVIIAIDDSSVRDLGHWPWPRSVHAQLLQVLAQARPKTVGLELLLSEPSVQPQDDRELAQAMRNPALGGVVLPVALEGPFTPGHAPRLNRPTPLLEQAAKGLGHTHVELDTDGMARGLHLFEGQRAQPPWPSLAWQMATNGTPGIQPPYPSGKLRPYSQIPLWQASPKVLLPYGGPPGHYRTIPYKSVLLGEVPPGVLTGKYVLIGVTATGIGSHYPTPASGSQALMPGVQINATALDGLLTHSMIELVRPIQALVLTLSVLTMWLIILWHLGPKNSAPALVLMLTVITLVCAFLLWFANLWLPPGNLATCSALAYVIWIWRRLVVVVGELNQQITHLLPNAQGHSPRLQAPHRWWANEANSYKDAIALFGTRPGYAIDKPVIDEPRKGWQEILKALDAGIVAAELHHALLSDTLHALPEAVLLTDPLGVIKLVNTRAKQLLGDTLTTGQNAASLLLLGDPASTQYQPNSGFGPASNWFDLMAQAQTPSGVEIGLKRQGQEPEAVVQLRATAVNSLKYLQPEASLATSNGLGISEREGWLVVLSDITLQKTLEQQRAHALQLLSHDIRAPQSALLILMRNLQTTGHLTEHQIETLGRMRLQIDTTLRLADDFVWLLRSQTMDYVFEEIDLVSLLHQVFDLAWPLAQAKSIHLQLVLGPFEGGNLWLLAEARLLERALFNLVENAIKYSEPHTETEISMAWLEHTSADTHVAPLPRRISVTVRDQGAGIAPHDLQHLCVRYRRLAPAKRQSSPTSGHGLGLALVHRVVGQHGGTLKVASDVGLGSRFTMILPVLE